MQYDSDPKACAIEVCKWKLLARGAEHLRPNLSGTGLFTTCSGRWGIISGAVHSVIAAALFRAGTETDPTRMI
jgi:hypothetical protein